METVTVWLNIVDSVCELVTSSGGKKSFIVKDNACPFWTVKQQLNMNLKMHNLISEICVKFLGVWALSEFEDWTVSFCSLHFYWRASQ